LRMASSEGANKVKLADLLLRMGSRPVALRSLKSRGRSKVARTSVMVSSVHVSLARVMLLVVVVGAGAAVVPVWPCAMGPSAARRHPRKEQG
jgi:hypothetical protein